MRRLAPLLAFTLLAATACSSASKHKAEPPPAPTSTSTSAPSLPTTSVTVPPPTNTTSTTKPTTTTTAGGGGSAAGVTIPVYAYNGPDPVECNAPTFIDLQWTVKGASTVSMHIDGGPAFTQYLNGARKETLPLTCDGKAHTYTLWATARGATIKKSVTVSTKKTA